MLTSATGVTVVMTGGLVLFNRFVSPVGELTLARFVKVAPLAGAVTVTVRLVACNAVSAPRFQNTLPLLLVPLELALTNVTPTGNVSVTTKVLALDGPK